MNYDRFRRSKNDWSQVLAFAWSNESFLKDLRINPKNAICELAGVEANSSYKGVVVDNDIKNAAINIKTRADNAPLESYSGYLPIPDPLVALKNLDKEKLEELLQNGITGILRFHERADLWADELHTAWNDSEKLKNIRQDPAKNLIHTEELSKEKLGIFPVPKRPRGLEKLEPKDLRDFLSDEDNMKHLAGIFLIGS